MTPTADGNALPTPPSRVEQVYDAMIDDICTGRLAPGTPLRQEILAKQYRVSRQPVQQALLLLKRHGLVRDFGRRGLEVTPVDAELVRNVYDVRGLVDGYAARMVAARGLSEEDRARGRALVRTGSDAQDDRAYAHMIVADVEFHRFLVEATGNPLLTESANVIWRNVQRVMGEVLLKGGCPAWVWEEHGGIFDAVEAGDEDLAELLALRHAEHARHLILAGVTDSGGDSAARGRDGLTAVDDDDLVDEVSDDAIGVTQEGGTRASRVG